MKRVTDDPTLEPRQRRIVLAGAGLTLIGAGLSVAMDAGARRQHGSSGSSWVAQGTAGLCLVGAGLSIFGEATALRAIELMRARVV